MEELTIVGADGMSIVGGVYEKLRRAVPRRRVDLRNYVKAFVGIDVPDRVYCNGHSSPMDYLWHAYNADFVRGCANADAVVWANRAGGKTELAAVATLLDCIFKPRCQVRILGGSLDQSSRMYEYLLRFVNGGFEGFLAEPIRKGRCVFANGAAVEILPQSSRAVRGRHVHKLRCDEVEMFDKDVFDAAKFITQSTEGLVAAMETISTMHRPYGLMRKLVAQAPQSNTPIFKWCMWEVIERCTGRSCSRCPLESDCRGRAKDANGYLKIDDCITQMKRSSRAGFESEMLCMRPSLDNAVFADFDPAVHVVPVGYDAQLPLYRAIDFGFVNPFVCLWIQKAPDGTVRVIDEYIRSKAAIHAHAELMKQRTPCDESAVAATFCDPAGAGRNDVTGTSAVRELRAMGIRVRYRRSGILEGIENVRRTLRDGEGVSRLVIDPKCSRLIEAMQCYHYPDMAEAVGRSEMPAKDGVYDHPIDALRYFFAGLATSDKCVSRLY